MADISITKAHSLGIDTAKERLNDFSATLEKEYGIKSSWDGNICNLKGTGLKKGSVTVTDAEVIIEITLGFLGKPFKNTIIDKVNSQFEKVLG